MPFRSRKTYLPALPQATAVDTSRALGDERGNESCPVVLRTSDRVILVAALTSLLKERPALEKQVQGVLQALNSGGPRHLEKHLGAHGRTLAERRS